MKKKLYILLILFPLWGLGGLSCSNDDDSGCVGIDCLPPATTTGEGTFGCLVNGEPFVDNSGNFNCFYQLVDGEYYFGITARRNIEPRQISLGSLKKDIILDAQINLCEREDNNFYAILTNNDSSIKTSCLTDVSGNIFFTELNLNSNIVSGTFEFEVYDEVTQTLYTITNGRFDAQFTQ